MAVEPLRLAAPNEALIREEAGIFTASSLRSFYLSISQMYQLLLEVTEQIQAPDEAAFVPIGGGMYYVSPGDPPIGLDGSEYMVCDGREISRVDYAELNTVLALQGYPFGDGDGSTTYNIPDCRDRAVYGLGANISMGDTGGTFNHVHVMTSIPAHTHTISDPGHLHAAGTLDAGAGHTHPAGSLVGGAHDHSYSLLQHTHVDTFSVSDSGHSHGITDPQHDHNAGSLVFANHSHGAGSLTVPIRNVGLQSGAGANINEVASATTQSVSGTTAGASGNVNGTTGTRATGITINSGTANVSISGSVGNVSGALPGGTTGSGGAVAVTGTTGTGGGGVITGNTATAVTGITVDSFGTPPPAETEPANPPYIGMQWVIRVKLILPPLLLMVGGML